MTITIKKKNFFLISLLHRIEENTQYLPLKENIELNGNMSRKSIDKLVNESNYIFINDSSNEQISKLTNQRIYESAN